MINTLLVAASLRSLEAILQDNEIPYEIYKDEASDMYQDLWEKAGAEEKALKMRQARPAIERIIHKEPYVFIKSGGPLVLKFNDESRKMKDSFGEMLLEREDLDWRIALSIKNDARIIASERDASPSDLASRPTNRILKTCGSLAGTSGIGSTYSSGAGSCTGTGSSTGISPTVSAPVSPSPVSCSGDTVAGSSASPLVSASPTVVSCACALSNVSRVSDNPGSGSGFRYR